MTPVELLNIMSSSVVTTGNLANSAVRGKPELLAFKPATGFKARKTDGSAVPVYTIVNTSNAQAGFDSYICDYVQGSTKYVTLGSDADFMFTVTMNGCTFGIGMPSPDGAVTVCHSNTAKSGGSTPPALQAQMQRLQVEQTLPSGGLVLEPANYRTIGKEQSTTFGIRRNDVWEFWMHTYIYSGSQTYTFGATTQIVGNQFALEPAWSI